MMCAMESGTKQVFIDSETPVDSMERILEVEKKLSGYPKSAIVSFQLLRTEGQEPETVTKREHEAAVAEALATIPPDTRQVCIDYGEAIEKAACELPRDYHIQIDIENGGHGETLYGPGGYSSEDPDGDGLAESVLNLIEMAKENHDEKP